MKQLTIKTAKQTKVSKTTVEKFKKKAGSEWGTAAYYMALDANEDKNIDVLMMVRGRDTWVTIRNVIELVQQVRVDASEDGEALRKRLKTLVSDDKLTVKFFEEINEKALSSEKLGSEEWSDPTFIVHTKPPTR